MGRKECSFFPHRGLGLSTSPPDSQHNASGIEVENVLEFGKRIMCSPLSNFPPKIARDCWDAYKQVAGSLSQGLRGQWAGRYPTQHHVQTERLDWCFLMRVGTYSYQTTAGKGVTFSDSQ